MKVNVQVFNIIYKLTDWLKEIIEERRPRTESMDVTGTLKVLKIFGGTKDKKVVGGKVVSGSIKIGGVVNIIRRDFEVGTGKIIELQANKLKTKEVEEGSDCGLQIETKLDIAPGDVLQAFSINIK